MSWSSRFFKPPPFIVAGDRFTAWLGLLVGWVAVGFGASSASRAAGLLLSYRDGACGIHSDTVCQVAGWGGLAMGVVALAGGTALWMLMARGFGPPTTWWVLTLLLAALAFAPFFAAEGAELPQWWLPISVVAAVLAIALAVLAGRRGKAARYGWIRLDGLDAREVPHRPVDKVVIPLAGAAAALAGAAFGAHVISLLAEA
ncbi:hypothetical protein SAMN04487783_1096 [Agrococcus baldri]|uniref:Uncharacterized protein n=1 Tax=Agrococcus baldri TaxID=153730 RepID=A0AA94KZ81_9MICO|nr:hypothetical protein [Agrococcus baldri]SFS08417.1 hypothetical protein SAMN04487783_1096 [Agrococcus baldri]